MIFVSIIAALLLEQFRPLRSNNGLYNGFLRYVRYIARNFNAGRRNDGMLAWLLALLPAVFCVLVASLLLRHINRPLDLLLNIGVLYFTLGFRHFSNFYNDIALALGQDDLARARALLSAWRGRPADEMNANEIARVGIELGLVHSHRHVFGVIAWFIVLGPAGALAYRIAALLNERWSVQHEDNDEFGHFAARAFDLMDWVPARLTALGFAAAGDFMGAVECWREQAGRWHEHGRGIVLASAAGALGIRLGGFLHREGGVEDRPPLGEGEDAGVDDMQAAVGLIWRALVLWVFLIALATGASMV